VLGLAIFVDVRLRETVVIIGDCSAVSLITIFLGLGYIHFDGKGTHIFSIDKTGGCSIFGVLLHTLLKLAFFMQNLQGNWQKSDKIKDFVRNI